MYELAHKKPFVSGDSEIDQVFKLFQIFGTPSETTWSGFSKLKFYKPTFPKWKPKNLFDCCLKFDSDAVDLFSRLMEINPAKRIDALSALDHPWFSTIDKSLYASPFTD